MDTQHSLSSKSFERVAAIAREHAGLTIPEAKLAMVQSRLSRRLRETRIPDFERYLDHIEKLEDAAELSNMISALTTNVSHFFREVHHFEMLERDVLPGLLQKARAGKKIRFWSAGCSSGQEPYTLAMVLLKADPSAAKLDVKILATDIDKKILDQARAAQYDARQVAEIDPRYAGFLKPAAGGKGAVTVTDPVKALVTFRELNLMKAWPMQNQFDVIFCRNVLIYFDEATQRMLWPRFENALLPDGWLLLGHSERVHDDARTSLRNRGVTSYQKSA